MHILTRRFFAPPRRSLPVLHRPLGIASLVALLVALLASGCTGLTQPPDVRPEPKPPGTAVSPSAVAPVQSAPGNGAAPHVFDLTTTPAQTWHTGPRPVSSALFDLDGDGALDALVSSAARGLNSNYQSSIGSLDALLSRSDGGWEQATAAVLSGTQMGRVLVSPLARGATEPWIFVQAGDGVRVTRPGATTVQLSGYVDDFDTAFDVTGRATVVATTVIRYGGGSPELRLWRQDTAGVWLAPFVLEYAEYRSPRFVDDAAFARSFAAVEVRPPHRLTLFDVAADGTIGPSQPTNIEGLWSLATVDLDGDGITELLAFDGATARLIGRVGGVWTVLSTTSTPGAPVGIAVRVEQGSRQVAMAFHSPSPSVAQYQVSADQLVEQHRVALAAAPSSLLALPRRTGTGTGADWAVTVMRDELWRLPPLESVNGIIEPDPVLRPSVSHTVFTDVTVLADSLPGVAGTVAVADVDADGSLDVAMVQDYRLVLLRYDDGGFQRTTLDAGSAQGMADECRWSFERIAALSGDAGTPDRVVAIGYPGNGCSGPAIHAVDVTALYASTGPVPPPGEPLGERSGYGTFKVGDFNGDGTRDLVMSCTASHGGLAVALWNKPAGVTLSYAPHVCFNADAPTSGDPTYAAFAGLLDSDDQPDLGVLSWGLSVTSTSPGARVCVANGIPFAQPAVFHATRNDRADVVFEGTGGRTTILRGNGRGGLGEPEPWSIHPTGDIHFDDLTPDPGNELWIADGDDVLIYFRQEGELRATVFPVGHHAERIHVADFNRDGLWDLLVETETKALLLVMQRP